MGGSKRSVTGRGRRSSAACLSAMYLALALLVVAAGAVAAAGATAAPMPQGRDAPAMPRELLALYDGEREPTPAETRVHRYAEGVLNHLGFAVVYRDIRGSLPKPEAVRAYAGILTWFATQPAARAKYLAWAEMAAPAARKVIVLGSVGGEFWTDEERAMRAILGAIGLDHERRAIELTLGTRRVEKARGLTRFERESDPVVPPYEVLRASGAGVDVWLQLLVPAREGGGSSVAVAVGPRGGFAAAGFEILEDRGHDQARWLIDPFAFFGRALAPEPWPVPDVTTLSGRRIYFSHVESDGLNNVIDRAKNDKILVAQRFLSDIVEAFPELPVTLALTPGDLDPSLGGNETPRALLVEIWSAPNVEASVASYTRPFQWQFFEHYVRDRETALARAAQPEASRRPAGRAGSGQNDEVPDWAVSRGRAFPRDYLARPFDLAIEVGAAVSAAKALLPEGKALRLYQWTGDAKPFEAAVAETRRLHLLNMNGGESRFDPDYPSVAHLAPLARPVGLERQVYAVAADERPLVKAWRPIGLALKGLGKTLENTEWPRRLKGYNLHYHLASVGDPQALQIIKGYLAEVREASVAPVRASAYAAMVDDFFTTAIVPLGESGWRVANRRTVQTVRFDGLGGRAVDLMRSRGVVGQTEHGGSVYVALDSAVEPAEIFLSNGPSEPAPAVSLADSRWQVSDLARRDQGWTFDAAGFGPGQFRWENAGAGTYRVTAGRAGAAAWATVVRARTDGSLSFTIPLDGSEGLGVSVARLAPDEAGARDD